MRRGFSGYASSVLGAAAEPMTKPLNLTLSPQTRDAIRYELVPGAVGAGLGAYFWKKHRWLGGLSGFGVGSNIHGLLRGDGVQSLCNMAVVGAGVFGSLRWKKHPALGFIVGNLAGSLVTSIVPGKDRQ